VSEYADHADDEAEEADMCGGCNVLAEGAGVSVIMARYWWVARQGRRAVAEAEALVTSTPVPSPEGVELVDPLPELMRVT
jgi:hypothetical protein